jgi:hypothetical protein
MEPLIFMCLIMVMIHTLTYFPLPSLFHRWSNHWCVIFLTTLLHFHFCNCYWIKYILQAFNHCSSLQMHVIGWYVNEFVPRETTSKFWEDIIKGKRMNNKVGEIIWICLQICNRIVWILVAYTNKSTNLVWYGDKKANNVTLQISTSPRKKMSWHQILIALDCNHWGMCNLPPKLSQGHGFHEH